MHHDALCTEFYRSCFALPSPQKSLDRTCSIGIFRRDDLGEGWSDHDGGDLSVTASTCFSNVHQAALRQHQCHLGSFKVERSLA
jgi:hypothetical protein